MAAVLATAAAAETEPVINEEKHPPVTPLYDVKSGTFNNPFHETWSGIPGFCKFASKMAFVKNDNQVPCHSPETLNETLPVVKPDFRPPADSKKLKVTWLGHACLLVQFRNEVTVITDPVFSNRCSPSQYVGPRRYRPPPCTVKELPPIDAVVISHNHYDHLDVETVRQLAHRFGEDLQWFVPLKLKPWMESTIGTNANVHELSWWEKKDITVARRGGASMQFISTPAQHWSGRTLRDRCKTLWCSWVVQNKDDGSKFFFGGDTGYCSAFKTIGDRLGPFDLAGIPIGAYEPREVMRSQHVNPQESVQIHQDIGAKRSVGIHWGTFVLTYEHYLDPRKNLGTQSAAAGLAPDEFFTLDHGESREI